MNMSIFECLSGYRSSLLSFVTCFKMLVNQYGLWDQLRVDHGTEWALILYVQNILSGYRNDTSRLPYIQTSSRQVCTGKLC